MPGLHREPGVSEPEILARRPSPLLARNHQRRVLATEPERVDLEPRNAPLSGLLDNGVKFIYLGHELALVVGACGGHKSVLTHAVQPDE